MRVLITGAAGFLGSHLTDRFLAAGHAVVGMDNLLTGSLDNIAHLAGHERFRFIHHDVTNFIFVDGPLDGVLHFASPASPVDYLKYPIQTLKVGALGTHKALGLAKAKGARFLLASTSEVYGIRSWKPCWILALRHQRASCISLTWRAAARRIPTRGCGRPSPG